MTGQVEQQICIKFCIKLEHSSVETIQMIQKTFGDNAMSSPQIKLWYKSFKDGWESVESDPPSGIPETGRTPENAECVRDAVNKDRRPTVGELEAHLGVPKTTVSEILMQDLGMKRVMGKFVLWIWLPEQKEYRAAVASDLIQTVTSEPHFLKKVITLKETEVSLSYVQWFLYLPQ